MFKFLKELLFIDQTTKLISHSKMWSNVGYALVCWSYGYAVLLGTSLETNTMFAFGMLVIGNKTVKEIFIKKDTK